MSKTVADILKGSGRIETMHIYKRRARQAEVAACIQEDLAVLERDLDGDKQIDDDGNTHRAKLLIRSAYRLLFNAFQILTDTENDPVSKSKRIRRKK